MGAQHDDRDQRSKWSADATAPTDAGAAGPAPPLAGALRLGRYAIDRILGAGAMGTVYTAHDPALDRQVALKAIRLGSDHRTAARVLREAQAIAKVSHPNVIHVYDVGQDPDGMLYIAMERVDGPTLHAWLRGEHGEREILDVFVAAGQGLAAAHAAGLVHRDFKPENVIVGTDGRVRVLDFGLARAAGGDELEAPPGDEALEAGPVRTSPMLTATGALSGTPAYMSPEQWRGEWADPRADQFSFCVALCAALTGRHPFDVSSRAALRESVLSRRPAIGPSVPAHVRRVLERGLAAQADARFPSMPDLLAALAPPRPRRGALVAVGALAAVALALVVWRLVPGGGPARQPAIAPPAVAVRTYGAPRRITARGDVSAAAMSADGERVAFIADDSLVVQGVAPGSEQRLLLRGDFGPSANLAWSPDGARLATSVALAGKPLQLVSVDVASGATAPLRDWVNMVALLPDGHFATAQYWGSNAVRIYAPDAPTTPSLECAVPGLPVGFLSLQYDPGSDALFVARKEKEGVQSTIFRFDRDCRSVQAVTESLDIESYAVDPGGRVWVQRLESGEVIEIGPDRKPTGGRLVLPNDSPKLLGVRRDGRVVYMTLSDDWRLAELRPDRSSRELLRGTSGTFLAVSPDGGWLAQIDGVYRQGELRLRRLDDLDAASPTVARNVMSAAWSPDGSRLALLLRRDRGYDLQTLERATGALASHGYLDSIDGGPPVWLDGDRVAVHKRLGWDLRSIDLRTGAQADAVPGVAETVYFIARSPIDGTLAYGAGQPGTARVAIWLRRAGQPDTRLATDLPVGDITGRELQWVADGRALVLFDGEGGTLRRIEVADGTVTRLPAVELPRASRSTLEMVAPLGDRMLVQTYAVHGDIYVSSPDAPGAR